VVKAARVLDVRKGAYIAQGAVRIEGGRILEAGVFADVRAHSPVNVKVIDLGNLTMLPGLIDCHTHLMARMDDGPDGYLLSLATKPEAMRALEGAADARATLRAGFTTVRDVESEGSNYADVALRDAIEAGLVEGPRMQVATRAIAATGQYHPFGVSPNLRDFPTGAQNITGADEARRAVREQISHGADLIKVYADWNYPTLTLEELRAIVEEAHKMKRKVAAHAATPEGIRNAVDAGVDSIEHGFGVTRETLDLMKTKGIFLVPTLGGIDLDEALADEKGPADPRKSEGRARFHRQSEAEVRQAIEAGVRIAVGFDAATATHQGRNAEELIALNRRGLSAIETIRDATLNAAELIGWANRVGSLEPGRVGDIIAVDGDPLADITVLRTVRFVMKGGEVAKDVAALSH
jgi:imidazolonepropionase-like amidohydrolase